jgi:tetratricopeptide (TPR) repeat protein
MILKIHFLSFVFFLVSFDLVAQSIGSSNFKKNSSESEKIFKQAEKLWKQEKYLEAEKLYLQANQLMPGSKIILELAKNKVELNDINGADKVCEIGINELKKNPASVGTALVYEKMAVYYFKGNNNLKLGNPATGVKDATDCLVELNKDFPVQQYDNFINEASSTAFYLNDLGSLKKINAASTSLELKRTEFVSSIYIKILEHKTADALASLQEAAKNGVGFMFSKQWAKSLLPIAYIRNGDYDLAYQEIKDGTKKSLLATESFYSQELGMISLYRKNYNEAIKQFSISLVPYKFVLLKQVEKGNKFSAYTNRALAYEGLNDPSKAKKDFESALIYNPDYEPALNGLARLEGRIITNRKTDKTPPTIVLSEPAAARGLKIVGSGKDVMVKGVATDQSGLKSVTINGNLVFSKEEGDFWGVIPLVEGKNKITIIASDMAGNLAEQIIEIEKPQSTIATNNDIVPVTQKEGRNFILLIASQNYDDQTIPSLDNPIPDAIKLKMILKNSYNFNDDNILTLFNPERTDFKKRFLELSEVIQPEDNLIIFYAGHGIWNEKEKKGYWLLTDAKRNDPNTWLPNKEVLTMISNLSSRHTLLITDACFSGSVFKTRSIGADAPPAVREMSEKISRVAITSGNDTEVPDQSVFMKYLIKALSENKEKYLTAQKMFITQIIEAVMTESKTEPRYGTLELAGHVGGDFIFTKK